MTRLLLKILVAAAALLSASDAQDTAQHRLAADDSYACVHPPYKVQLFSKSPLVIYITDFITPEERTYMLNLANNTFKHSAVISSSGATIDTSTRTSSSTNLPPYDPVVRCIESRAAAFQGLHTQTARLEPIQLVRYSTGEHYHFHTDWFLDPAYTSPRYGGQRVSSFFGYVGVGEGTTGGGTNFPALDAPDGGGEGGWCGVVDCDEEYARGVTFRPVEGNVVYWENVGAGGEGDLRTLHAGLPVTAGWKVGMNIWTREWALGEGIKGEGASAGGL